MKKVVIFERYYNTSDINGDYNTNEIMNSKESYNGILIN